MPLRNFRNVEYYMIMKDDSWATGRILIPEEIPYEDSVDYIWGELTGMEKIENIKSISISNFPPATTTVTG